MSISVSTMASRENLSRVNWGIVVLALVVMVGSTGCVQTNLTAPPRAGMEQLLMSTAADRAWNTVSLDIFTNKSVFVSSNYFEAYDAKYALGTIRDALSRAGARLVASEEKADLIVEPRSGALSIDEADSIIGIPTTGLPIPLAGNIEIPEIALFKSEKQFSVAKFAILAYSKDSGEHYYSSGPLVGDAFTKYYRLLWVISYTSTDIPEKQRKSRQQGEFSSPPPPNRPISH